MNSSIVRKQTNYQYSVVGFFMPGRRVAVIIAYILLLINAVFLGYCMYKLGQEEYKEEEKKNSGNDSKGVS